MPRSVPSEIAASNSGMPTPPSTPDDTTASMIAHAQPPTLRADRRIGGAAVTFAGKRDIFCRGEAAPRLTQQCPQPPLGTVPNTGHEVSDRVIDVTVDRVERALVRHV
jgi:hypothetical protein